MFQNSIPLFHIEIVKKTAIILYECQHNIIDCCYIVLVVYIHIGEFFQVFILIE